MAFLLNPICVQVPMMALTATAVPRVRNDIITSLELASPFVSVRLPHTHYLQPNLSPRLI